MKKVEKVTVIGVKDSRHLVEGKKYEVTPAAAKELVKKGAAKKA